jgi:hypothetical protein
MKIGGEQGWAKRGLKFSRLRQYENMIRAEQRRMVEKARDEAFVLEMKELEEMEERQRTRQQQQEEQQW